MSDSPTPIQRLIQLIDTAVVVSRFKTGIPVVVAKLIPYRDRYVDLVTIKGMEEITHPDGIRKQFFIIHEIGGEFRLEWISDEEQSQFTKFFEKQGCTVHSGLTDVIVYP